MPGSASWIQLIRSPEAPKEPPQQFEAEKCWERGEEDAQYKFPMSLVNKSAWIQRDLACTLAEKSRSCQIELVLSVQFGESVMQR